MQYSRVYWTKHTEQSIDKADVMDIMSQNLINSLITLWWQYGTTLGVGLRVPSLIKVQYNRRTNWPICRIDSGSSYIPQQIEEWKYSKSRSPHLTSSSLPFLSLVIFFLNFCSLTPSLSSKSNSEDEEVLELSDLWRVQWSEVGWQYTCCECNALVDYSITNTCHLPRVIRWLLLQVK